MCCILASLKNKPHFVLAVDPGCLRTACCAGGGMLEEAGAEFLSPTGTRGALPESTQLSPPSLPSFIPLFSPLLSPLSSPASSPSSVPHLLLPPSLPHLRLCSILFPSFFFLSYLFSLLSLSSVSVCLTFIIHPAFLTLRPVQRIFSPAASRQSWCRRMNFSSISPLFCSWT